MREQYLELREMLKKDYPVRTHYHILKGEYLLIDTEDTLGNPMSVEVYLEDNKLRVMSMETIDGEVYKTEDKYFKAYQFAHKMVQRILG